MAEKKAVEGSALTGPLVEEAKRRLADARGEKDAFTPDYLEAYQFCMPARAKPGTQTSTRSNTNSQNFTSLGAMLTADFASEISDTYAPQHTPWVKEEVSASIRAKIEGGFVAGDVDDLEKQINLDCNAVLDSVGASPFYRVFKQGCKDLSISAFGIITQDPGKGGAMRCEIIPLPELLMLRGASGGLDFRAWEQNVTVEQIQELFPDIKLPPKVAAKKDRKKAKVKKTYACWRDYSKPGEIGWHTMTLLDDEAVEYSRSEGEGSALIQICRWDPDPTFAWTNGPAVVALPDYRALDETEYLELKGLARGIDPPVAYDDDGVINLEGGLPNGTMIPRLQGSKIDVIESSHPNSMSEAEAKITKIEHTIRRHYFLDEPQQEGLTPPTLGQWMDESMRRQRRLGAPAAEIWEFLSEVFLRFRYLLIKRGDLQPITFKGQNIILEPINPLRRAAEMEEAAADLRTLQSLEQTFPGQTQFFYDIGETVHEIVRKAQATGLKLKPAAEINKALQNAQAMAAASQAAGAIGQSGVMPLLAANKQGQPA